MLGDRLGRYEIIGPLGAGGMGEVYRARDTELKREVAVKVLPEHLAASTTAMARFRREAEMLAAVNHPGIATIHSIEESDGTRFLVLELVEGETLAARLGKGPLASDEFFAIAGQIAEALAAAHERGIVHRDLKPANVMLGADGRVKLLDFGLALPLRLVGGEDHIGADRIEEDPSRKSPTEAPTEIGRLTAAGSFLGTAPFMSPEQIRGGSVDRRTDVWAFGCVLFEMLTGRGAFEAETRLDTIAAILERDPDWAALPSHVPAGIRTLIRRCLRKDPAQRVGDMADAGTAIREAERPAAAVDLGGPIAGNRRAALALGTAVVVILALAVAANVGGMRDLIVGATRGTRSGTGAGNEVGGGAGGGTGAESEIGGATDAGGAAVRSATAPADRLRIAVLPFENLGNDDEEYFSEGITQDINTQISKIGDFLVIAHGSARRMSQAEEGYREMAAQLGVDYIVGGSVSRAGAGVRITASLIDPTTDDQLWRSDYDHELSVANVFAVRSEVAREVARALDVTLSPAQETAIDARPTQSLEAYRQYQLGRFFWDKRTVEGFDLALGHFERAIALDADYALAYVGLADTYLIAPWFSSSFSNRVALARAETAARQALALDASLGEAHTTLGLVREWQYEWEAAEREFLQAIDLTPGHATAHHWFANLLGRLGRHEEALAEIQRALELDPLSLIINQDFGYNLDLAGDTEAAGRQFERTLQLDPSFVTTRLVLAFNLLKRGRFDDARDALAQWASLTGNDPLVVAELADVAARHAESGEEQSLPPGMEVEVVFPPYSLARVYLAVGQRERALQAFEQAYEDGAFAGVASITSPAFAILRSEPRFVELLRKVGLER